MIVITVVNSFVFIFVPGVFVRVDHRTARCRSKRCSSCHSTSTSSSSASGYLSSCPASSSAAASLGTIQYYIYILFRNTIASYSVCDQGTLRDGDALRALITLAPVEPFSLLISHTASSASFNVQDYILL